MTPGVHVGDCPRREIPRPAAELAEQLTVDPGPGFVDDTGVLSAQNMGKLADLRTEGRQPGAGCDVFGARDRDGIDLAPYFVWPGGRCGDFFELKHVGLAEPLDHDGF